MDTCWPVVVGLPYLIELIITLAIDKTAKPTVEKFKALGYNVILAIRSNMTDHVVHFALFYLLLIWYICSMGYIISVTFTKPGGYPNRAPRAYTAEGAIYRTKCSAENTFESMVCFLIAVAIYEKAANDYAQELIASWAVLVMLARTMYPGESCLCTSFFASSFISFYGKTLSSFISFYGKTLSVFILIITDFIILP